MPILIRNIIWFVLLSGVIAVAGCSWPSVKIGEDKYLISLPTIENKK